MSTLEKRCDDAGRPRVSDVANPLMTVSIFMMSYGTFFTEHHGARSVIAIESRHTVLQLFGDIVRGTKRMRLVHNITHKPSSVLPIWENLGYFEFERSH